MCVSLANDGHEVHLVAPVDLRPERSATQGVELHPLPKRTSRLRRMSLNGLQAFRTVRQIQADINHFHDPEFIPFALLLRLLHYSVVYDVHEDVTVDVADKAYLPAWARKFVARMVHALSQFSLPRFSGVVSAGDDITRALPTTIEKIETIHNYPDLARIRGVSKSGRQCDSVDTTDEAANPTPFVVYFGGIRANEIAMNTAKAIEIVNAQQPVRLVLGGRVHDEDRFHELKSTSAWRFVDYVGQISFERMLSLCAESVASIVLYPNNENSQNVRSNRLFESMALGRPVVVPDFPNWRAFIQEAQCGILADPDNPAEIAKAIVALLANPGESQSMGHRGRHLVESRWNWSNEYQRLVSLYYRILQR